MGDSDAIAKAHEALQLFSAIESSGAFEDKRDAERLAATKQPSIGRDRNAAGSSQRTSSTSAPRGAAGAAKVDDAIMTKLHRRNKELVAEVEDLKRRLSSGSIPRDQPSNGSSAPTAHSELALVRAENRLLQKQLAELRAVNLRSIDAGEATGKVNRDVKEFFHVSIRLAV